MTMVVFIILCFILWLLPLPFGGNIEWAVFGFELSVWLLFLIYTAIKLFKATEPPEVAEKGKVLTRPICCLLGIFFLIGLIQLIPWPKSVVSFLSPTAFSWWNSLVQNGLFDPAEVAFQSLSLSRWASAYELVKYLSYGAFVYLLAKYLDSRKKIIGLTAVLITAGLFQSLYGLSEFFSGSHRIFNWFNRYYAGSAFGTFVNRDHYSAFLEMIFPLSLGYFLARSGYFALRPGLTWRQKLARFGQEEFQKSLLFILPPIIIGIGLFFSRCRSGIIIFIVTFFLTLILLSITSISGKRKTEKRLVQVAVLLVILAVVLIGIEPILERFALFKGGFFEEGRFSFYASSLDLIGDYPILGCGLGTYVQAINPYLQKNFNAIIDHAHNDYLEMLAEAGLLGGGALILAALLAFALALRRWLNCRDPLGRGIGLGASIGVLALLFHSLTDFSLRMPGNAVTWLSLFVLALKAPLILEDEEDSR
ncbi:MAG: O-antigen ligase family protein [Candidatus Saccharicenans sp.]|nr:O-antigen ligase family protein [Candidatus Saccharicenans sp.]